MIGRSNVAVGLINAGPPLWRARARRAAGEHLPCRARILQAVLPGRFADTAALAGSADDFARISEDYLRIKQDRQCSCWWTETSGLGDREAWRWLKDTVETRALVGPRSTNSRA
jgi:hypothetical protein